VPAAVPKFEVFAGTELHPPAPQTTVLIVESVTDGGRFVEAVTVTIAAPFTAEFADEAAVMFVVPAPTPVTVPSLPTVATAAFPELHVTPRLV